MLWILLACGSGTPKSPLDTVETDDSGDTAHTGDTGDGVVWNCGIYAPQAVLWTTPGEVGYRSTFSVEDEVHPDRVRTYEGLGTAEMDGIETFVHASWDGLEDSDGTVRTWEATTWYICDERGLQQHKVEMVNTVIDAEGNTTVESSTRLFTSPPLIYPPDMALGSAWDCDASYVETLADGSSAEGTLDTSREITEIVDVSVPAGDFSTLHLVMTDNTTGNSESLWLAAEVGAVMGDTTELVSHETFGP